jgi:hypothetical protein
MPESASAAIRTSDRDVPAFGRLLTARPRARLKLSGEGPRCGRIVALGRRQACSRQRYAQKGEDDPDSGSAPENASPRRFGYGRTSRPSSWRRSSSATSFGRAREIPLSIQGGRDVSEERRIDATPNVAGLSAERLAIALDAARRRWLLPPLALSSRRPPRTNRTRRSAVDEGWYSATL